MVLILQNVVHLLLAHPPTVLDPHLHTSHPSPEGVVGGATRWDGGWWWVSVGWVGWLAGVI